MQYETLLAGAYEVEKTLDRSTYSVLCVGKQAKTGQAVRLRLWLTAHVTSPEEQQRIQAEVAAIQAVQHPHLLSILDVRATEQGVFLASASAQNGSLNTRLSQHFLKPLPLAEALMIVKQVGQALQALHEHGITHGNLTPLAIFFTEPEHVCLGELYVLSIQQSIQGYQPLLDENIPRCWYMAPEQFSGQLDAQTDQYALGCLAYVLLTGRVPFAGSARATLLQKHQNEQPRSLIALNVDVPAFIEGAVLKALAKLPTERHSSVLAFLQALGEAASTPIVTQLDVEEVIIPPIIVQLEPDEAAIPPIVTQPRLEQAADAPVDAQSELDTIQAFADLATLKQPALLANSVKASFGAVALGSRVRPHPAQVARVRGLAVLVPMIALVLVIVLVLGSWIVLAASRTPSQVAGGGTTPSTTQGVSATATATSSLQPTIAETVNAIGLHYPTPTARPAVTPTVAPTAPTATATTPPTATPTASPATVTPLLDCVKQSGTGWIAHFGYMNS
ncbi:MAG: serine/threonine-protein kinase, partial [Ktedonobacteraceae bacterium]